MCGGSAIVHIKHEDGNDDGERDKDHGEEQVLANQGDDERSGRDGLSDDQEEDSEGEKDGNAQRHFLTTVRRKVKDENGQERDQKAWDYEVDGVEQRQAPDVEAVGNICVDLLTAVVLDVMLVARRVDDLPLAALPEVLDVDPGANQHQIYLGFVVCPGTKLHRAVLVIKGEVGDVHWAGGLEDGWRNPGYGAIILQQSFGLVFYQEVTYSTKATRRLKTVCI